MLCPICRHVNVLCQVCEAELASGKLTRAEVDMARLMARRKVSVNILAVFDLGRRLVVLVGEGESDKVRNLWKDYILFEEGDVDVAKLISPVTLRKTKVFMPGGKEGERFVVSRGELRAAGFDLTQLEHALERLALTQSVRFI